MDNMLADQLIKLRAPEPRDVDAIFLTENDPSLWHDGVTFAPLSRKQLWDYVDTYNGDIFATGQLRMVIELSADGTYLGVVDLYDYDRINRRAYVGITVSASHRHEGIGSHALTLLCDYCKRMLNMHQLAAIVRADNLASTSLFARCGFELTGRLPQWIHTPSGWADALHLQRIL